MRVERWGILGALSATLTACTLIAPLEDVQGRDTTATDVRGTSISENSAMAQRVSASALSRPPAGGRGRLTLGWLIDDRRNTAAACDETKVETIDLDIVTSQGIPVWLGNEHCDLLEVSVDMAPGIYAGEAVLLGFDGEKRTTTARIRDTAIEAGQQIRVVLEFTRVSFLAPIE